MNTRETLEATAARFPILPDRLADALDEHGGEAMAWVWIVDGKLINLEVIV